MAGLPLLFYLLLGSMFGRALILLFLFTSLLGWSQTFKGKVINHENKEGLPFTNLAWINSGIATISDQNGEFIIGIPEENDTLLISSIGFNQLKIPKEKALASSIIELNSEDFKLEEVQVKIKKRYRRKRKTNPAYILQKNIVKHRQQNDIKKLDFYDCEIYNKIEMDLNNIDSTTKNDILFKPVSFVFENIDTSSLPKAFCPIFMSEAFSHYHYKKSPKQERDIIKASQNSGLKIKGLAKFTGNTYLDFNIYDEYINLFQKSFVSPLADQAWISYNFYLMDSTVVGDTTIYRLDFFPRRQHDLTFKGFMYVDNKTFGVRQIHLEMAEEANVNYLQWLVVDQKYSHHNSIWQLDHEKIFMDINPFDRAYGFYVIKNTYYQNYQLNNQKPGSFYKNAEKVVVEDSAYEKGAEKLEKLRPIALGESEKETYHKIDSAMETGYAKVMKNLAQMVYTGYYPFKYWEYGPYYTTYSYNSIEGQRLRVGFQTTQNLLKTTHFQGALAYGLGDEVTKYRGQVTQFYGLKKWRFFQIEHLNDYKILSASSNAFQEDNIMASLTRRTDPKFTHTIRTRATWLHEWYNGINNSLTYKKEQFKPIGSLTYQKPDGTFIDNLYLNSFTVGGRIAMDEKFVNYGFRRLSLNTRKPRLDYSYTRGFKVNGKGYNFHKAEFELNDRYYIGFLGFFDMTIFGGKIWGTLPYPLLLNHQGNDSYYFDNRAFNRMNPFEFVSDQHISALLRHNFNGMFFNGVPLLRKLHLRSFIFARGVYGTLENRHQGLVVLPEGLTELDEPYLEAGFGIENIFHLIRLDFIWRLSSTPTDMQRFGITFDIVPSF